VLAIVLALIDRSLNMDMTNCVGRWQVGKNYFIRTVTHHLTGTLVEVTPQELWLKDAAWIADDGRFMQALRDGTLNEIEPFPDGAEVPVGRGALIDAVVWVHPLPRTQK
jgi:hypothetical protein